MDVSAGPDPAGGGGGGGGGGAPVKSPKLPTSSGPGRGENLKLPIEAGRAYLPN